MLTIPVGDHSKQILRVFSWLVGHLPFLLQLRMTTFGEPKQGTMGWGGAGQDRGSTGRRRFLLLNQVAPGTPQSLEGTGPAS